MKKGFHRKCNQNFTRLSNKKTLISYGVLLVLKSVSRACFHLKSFVMCKKVVWINYKNKTFSQSIKLEMLLADARAFSRLTPSEGIRPWERGCYWLLPYPRLGVPIANIGEYPPSHWDTSQIYPGELTLLCLIK